MIALAPVEGSAEIAAWGWERWREDPKVGTLTLEFVRTGARWHYAAVPEWVVASMLLAPSIGRFFHQRIRDVYAGMPAVSEFNEILAQSLPLR